MIVTKKQKISNKYKVPAQTRIGHVHLKVSDLDKALVFYRDILGFKVTMMYGDQAAFLSAGGYHHHIGLNTWESEGASPAKREGVGLYHAAIVYPERSDLAAIIQRIRASGYPINGASDHGVSEAIYLRDPDNNGIELYWDRPIDVWPKKEDGKIDMYTKPLDIQSLLKTLKQA